MTEPDTDDFRHDPSNDTSLRARLRRFFLFHILYPGDMISCPGCKQDCFKSRRTRSKDGYDASPLCLFCWDKAERLPINDHHIAETNKIFQQYSIDPL